MRASMSIALVLTAGVPLGAALPQMRGVSGLEYRAPDNSMTFRLPDGWRAATADLGGTPIHVLQPGNGAEDRIFVGTGPVTVSTIQDLAALSVQVVTQQLLPGSRLTSQPRYASSAAGPLVELRYELANPPSVWYHVVVMTKDRRYIAVLGGARAARSASMEQQSRGVLESVSLAAPTGTTGGSGAPGGMTAQALVGHWTWYHQTNAGGGSSGSTSKELWFYPNGRYQYTATTYVPNMPPGIDPTTTITGSYQLQGNRLTGRADNGQSAAFTVEIVDGGRGLKIDGELWIREG